jgi:Uncharacterized conserved protein
MSYGTSVTLKQPFGEVVAATRAALAAQGFGVLTEIDVQATMKAKLGEDLAPYLILGACNPPLAHRALQSDPSIGLLLPCNVVVRETEDGTFVEAIDPMTMVSVSENPALQPVADEAASRLRAALAALSAN